MDAVSMRQKTAIVERFVDIGALTRHDHDAIAHQSRDVIIAPQIAVAEPGKEVPATHEHAGSGIGSVHTTPG